MRCAQADFTWSHRLRALIVDDEAPARAKVRRLLEASGDVQVVGEATTGREAVAAIKRSRPDIVFLDIQMPGLDGFGVIDTLQDDEPPYIVFVTADDRQALRAFEAGAVDYLLKPFTPQRFAQVIERARARQSEPVSVPPTEHREYLKRILLFENGRATFVPVASIDRVESERNYVRLHAGGRQHRLRATIATVETRLDPEVFLRINRSTLVRLDAVRSMTEWSHGDYKIVMNDGVELTWSRRYRGAAARKLGLLGG